MNGIVSKLSPSPGSKTRPDFKKTEQLRVLCQVFYSSPRLDSVTILRTEVPGLPGTIVTKQKKSGGTPPKPKKVGGQRKAINQCWGHRAGRETKLGRSRSAPNLPNNNQ